MKTMLFNPYSGKPRHPSDIASDPAGILMLDPDEPVLAYKPAADRAERAAPEPVVMEAGMAIRGVMAGICAYAPNFDPRLAQERVHQHLRAIEAACMAERAAPIDMVLYCPNCGKQHVDAPEPDLGPSKDGSGDMPLWSNPPHRSHLCHSCSTIWRPADVPTNGVAAVKTTGKADTWVGKAPFAAPAIPSSGAEGS